MTVASSPQLFTQTSAISLGAVAGIGLVAYVASRLLLPKKATRFAQFTFVWLAFDAMVHASLEGSFLFYSMFGRQINTSEGLLPDMWKEYAKADFRWGFSDSTVVSLEILTVFGGAPMALWILRQLINDDPARHYWIVVLCTAELYGGWMTFCPEWLTGSVNLDTSNILYLWVYLVFMNVIWVVIPLWLMVDSYGQIAQSLRLKQSISRLKKA